MRNVAKITILAVACVFLAQHDAQADQRNVMNFSCDGTITGPGKPEPVHNIGVVVDAGAKTVSFTGYVARITEVDAAMVSFEGQDSFSRVSGSIDRVTGSMTAMSSSGNTGATWELLCKRASPLF